MKSLKVKIASLTPSRRHSKAQAAVIELCPNHLWYYFPVSKNHSVILAFGCVSQPFLVCLCSVFHSASENSDCVTFPSRPPFLLYANSWWYRLRIERNSILSWRSMRSFPFILSFTFRIPVLLFFCSFFFSVSLITDLIALCWALVTY